MSRSQTTHKINTVGIVKGERHVGHTKDIRKIFRQGQVLCKTAACLLRGRWWRLYSDSTNEDPIKHVQQSLNHAAAVLSCSALCVLYYLTMLEIYGVIWHQLDSISLSVNPYSCDSPVSNKAKAALLYGTLSLCVTVHNEDVCEVWLSQSLSSLQTSKNPISNCAALFSLRKPRCSTAAFVYIMIYGNHVANTLVWAFN